MESKKIIPDSTFFSFFLHNTNNPIYLKKIIENFYVEIPPRVYKEIQRCKYFSGIESFKEKMHIFDDKLNFSELLKPLFSKEQKERGEHDVLVVGYFCYNLGIDFVMILDDTGARKFIKNNFSYLESYLKWTANFIKECYSLYNILNKEESLNLLYKMKESTFRIDCTCLENLIKEIEND